MKRHSTALLAFLLAAPGAALAYGTTATLAFEFGGSLDCCGGGTFPSPSVDESADRVWSTAYGLGGTPYIEVNGSSVANSYFGSGFNAVSYYNPAFRTAADCAIGAGIVPGDAASSSTRKYGCRWTTSEGSPAFGGATPYPFSSLSPAPRARAEGTLTATDTTLTGTLHVVPTTPHPTGATTTLINGTRISNSAGNGATGFNYRVGDGSIYRNAWYGVSDQATLEVNLLGTFTATGWSISGGTVRLSDPGFACQQGGLGGVDGRGALCTPSTLSGGFQNDGSHLSWGVDPDGAGPGTALTGIELADAAGTYLDTLPAVLASLTLDANGNIAGYGQYRRAQGGTACPSGIRITTDEGPYANTYRLTCGTLTAGALTITGQATVPLPGSLWLLASGFGLLGAAGSRRERAS